MSAHTNNCSLNLIVQQLPFTKDKTIKDTEIDADTAGIRCHNTIFADFYLRANCRHFIQMLSLQCMCVNIYMYVYVCACTFINSNWKLSQV